MKIASIGCGFAGLVAGVALGWGLASHRAPAVAAAAPLLPPVTAAVATVPLQTPVVTPAESAGREGQTVDPAVLNQLAKMRWLADHGREFQDIESRTPNRVFTLVATELDPTFIQAFGLTAAEVERLQSAAAQTLAQLSEQMAAQTTVEIAADLTFARVLVPRLSDSGSSIYDELVGTFRTTLGPERMAHFNTLVGEHFDRELRRYGAEDLVYEIRRRTDDKGSVYIEVSEATPSLETSGTEEHASWGFYDGVEPTDPKRYPMLSRVVPPGLLARLRKD